MPHFDRPPGFGGQGAGRIVILTHVSSRSKRPRLVLPPLGA
jgi:hypothetical protein